MVLFPSKESLEWNIQYCNCFSDISYTTYPWFLCCGTLRLRLCPWNHKKHEKRKFAFHFSCRIGDPGWKKFRIRDEKCSYPDPKHPGSATLRGTLLYRYLNVMFYQVPYVKIINEGIQKILFWGGILHSKETST
jgi:hypothetical protein